MNALLRRCRLRTSQAKLLGGTLAKRVGSPGGEEDMAKMRLEALAEEALRIAGKRGRRNPRA